MLKYASTIFHFGVLAAIGGHVLGILVPRSWTAAVGVSDDAYHVIAVIGGPPAGPSASASPCWSTAGCASLACGR